MFFRVAADAVLPLHTAFILLAALGDIARGVLSMDTFVFGSAPIQ